MNRLFPDADGAWIVRVDGADQSWIDLDDPTRLEFDYMKRIADHLDVHRPAGERMRVIHVGGAGMCLARYVAATRPTSPQIVCEPDTELTAEVRLKAPLPARSGIKVRPVDGRSGVAAMREDFADVVILDAFKGAQVPGDLVTVEFFADVSRILHSDGLVVANLADSAPLTWTKRVVRSAETVFSSVCLAAESSTLKGRRYGNIILAASHGPLHDEELVRRYSGAAFPFRLITGDALAKLLAGARPFCDDDTESSPGPPGGATFFS
ncbi:spermidine synthase [Cutibacterium sp. WCA-380-WT-3A]|uniref:Spermidine synthase n=1 Tax=Cutibacterium porci TaxID=2605781 RepID=A0A7K0J911_9ACTN|nr:fused MFS/spermidine synthase [Cutibacterium porci]MSS46248.1 spermidine synthase [Cutibacterium porci]